MLNEAIKQFMENNITVEVRSTGIENLINSCIEKGIIIKDIRRINYTTALLKMNYTYYKAFKRIAKQTNSRAKISNKYGVHFSIKKFFRRRFFIVGFFLSIIFLLFLSNLVWSIKILGTNKIDDEILYKAMNDMGLRVGAMKSTLNLRNIEQGLVKNINEISLVKIEYSGTKAIVQVVERTLPVEIANTDSPADIISSKFGIVDKLTVYKGIPLVKIGDYIKPGQLLIKGIVTDIEETDALFTHAKGIVTAKTWYEATSNVSFNHQYEIRNGNHKQIIFYEIGKYKLFVKKGNIPYKKYDKIEEKNSTTIAGIHVPITKVTDSYYEKSVLNKKLTYAEAYSLCVMEAKKHIAKILPPKAKLLNVKLYKTSDKNCIKVRLLYIMEENIGIEKAVD